MLIRFLKKYHLDYLKFIFYGLVQGLTEFIPVSSTAHLKILSLLFGFDDPGSSISAIIQIGSVFAIFYFYKINIFDFKKLYSRNSKKPFLKNKLIRSIFIATIPILLIGGIIKLFIPEFSYSFLRSNFSIGLFSIIMAVFMFLADFYSSNLISLKNHKYINSLFIGIAQAFAIIPGVSRSGATISMALLSGWKRRDSAQYSFLIGLPALSLTAFGEILISIDDLSSIPFYPLIVGLITSFFSSLLAIDFLIKYISSKGLKIFVYYRLIFGAFIILNL